MTDTKISNKIQLKGKTDFAGWRKIITFTLLDLGCITLGENNALSFVEAKNHKALSTIFNALTVQVAELTPSDTTPAEVWATQMRRSQ